MKYQLEPVYQGTAGAFPTRYSLQYRSKRQDDPFDEWRGAHGYGWVSPFERRVKFYDPATNPGSGSYGVKRPDGREFEFKAPASGNVYVADADVPDKLERLADGGGATTGWKYTSAAGDEIETYDASGLLLEAANRAGARTSLTYSSGTSNDASVSRYPGNAPVCSAIHPAMPNGNPLAARRLLCVTDPDGRQINFQYDSQTATRIIVLIDPAGGEYQFEYDGVSGGCATPGSDTPKCTARNLTKVTYPDGPARVYHYNESANINGGAACAGLTNGLLNNLTGITDENGSRFADYTYDCLGRTTGTQHAGGVEKATFAYNAGGTTTVADYVGNPGAPAITGRKYSFQTTLGVPRTSGVVDPATGLPAPCAGCGSTASSSYDANGNVASRTDWNGNRTNYAYDLARNLETSRTEGLTSTGAVSAATRTIETSWHASYRLPTQVVDKNSSGVILRTTALSYDAAGNLLTRSVTANPSGTARSWNYTYNANGLVLTADGPRTDVADVTSYTYYASDDPDPGKRGNIATITNALGHVTNFTSYNAHGQPLVLTDPNGLTTALAYDARQRLTSRTVGGEMTAYTYDGVGQLTRVTLPDGSFLDYGYDAAHRLAGIADNLGNRIAYTLDLQGNRTLEQVFDPANQLAQTRSRLYSNLNRLAQELGAAAQATTFAYDNQGNLTSLTDPNARVTTNAYDALNRLVRATDPLSGQVNYGYNALDQLVSVSDPRSLVTSYGYDGLGNLKQLASPDTGTTINTYDAAGNVLASTDAKGQVTTYAYDALNRVTAIAYQGGVVHSYEYDQGANGLGRLTRITEPNGTTQYAYDQKGRLTAETRLINALSYVTSYAYDAAGRMTGMTYPSGRQVSYTLDALGRVSQITTTKAGTATVLSGVAYQPFGPVRAFTFGNGQTHLRSFDPDARIAGYTLGGRSFAVGYDAASRIVSISEPANPANSNAYGYDSLDRLTQAVLPGTPFAYSYDAAGNRLSKTVGAATETYAYAAASNRLSSVASAAGAVRNFAFDAVGSTTSDGVNQFSYDTRGRLAQADTLVGPVQYRVNALGQRVRKTRGANDTVFHYDSRGRLIAETDAAGALKAEYIYLGDMPVAVVK